MPFALNAIVLCDEYPVVQGLRVNAKVSSTIPRAAASWAGLSPLQAVKIGAVAVRARRFTNTRYKRGEAGTGFPILG